MEKLGDILMKLLKALLKSHATLDLDCAPMDFLLSNEFSWDPTIASDVRSQWEAKTKSRLRDPISKLAKDDNKKAAWCSTSIRSALKQKREDPKFKEKSKKCSDAKLVGPNAGSVHCQGSISSEYLREKMTKELGRCPTLAEVFKRSHEVKGFDESFVDQKSNTVWNKFLEIQATDSQHEAHATQAEMFLEASGGFDKKRRLYGVGSLGKLYYKPPHSNSNCSKKICSERELELENQVAELVVGNKAQVRKVEHLQAQLDELFQYLKSSSRCNQSGDFGSFSPPPPPPSMGPSMTG